MPRQMRCTSDTGIYHVMQRGINKQRLFEQSEDYAQFLFCLKNVKKQKGFILFAYCLLDNHFHLLIKVDETPLSEIFKSVGIRYVRWFNQKYERVGHLFQDRFRSEPISIDSYFQTVLVYIYQNPVRAGLCRKPEEYEWSSRRSLHEADGLIDLDELRAIVTMDEIVSMEQNVSVDKKYEPMAGKHCLYSDEDIARMMLELCGTRTTNEVLRLSQNDQQILVAKLRERRAPIRQVSRMTGISKGVIERWGKL